jgi:pyruvate/2-oxoglutarate dehydrogenase complex dihydrolipoamide acyltransferase (E2) component
VSSSRTEAALVDVTMPQMGVSVAEGTIVEWKRQVGEEIAADETICEISTDKIDTEVPAPVSGTVAEIVVDVGETVTVGTVIARISTDATGALDPPSETAAPAPAAEEEETAPTNGARAQRGRYSPVVQRIAAQHDIDLEQIEGTGRGGRVRKQDVLAYLEQRGEAAEPRGERAAPVEEPPLHIESPYRPEPVPAAPAGAGLSRMRRQIGEHMKRSLETAATCTTWIEADMTRVEAARRELGLTALPIVARATIDSLREFPALNATLDGDDYQQYADVNLGIAVSLGDDGLIVPVIHRAQELAPEGLGARIRDLAKRARGKQLVPDEVRGGTFTITNPGQYGSIMATPVINQPQVAILDLEAIVKRPVVIDDAIAIRSMTILGLSWDHRALDGALAAQFLAALKGRLESVSA